MASSQSRKRRKINFKDDDNDGMGLMLETARLFVACIRERFHGKKNEVFQKFRDLVKNHLSEQVLGTESLVAEVKPLFAGHDDLASGFEFFMLGSDGTPSYPRLPKKIPSSPDSITSPVEPVSKKHNLDLEKLEDAVDYVNKLKRLVDRERFDSFVELHKDFKEHKDTDRLFGEAFEMFQERFPVLEIALNNIMFKEIKGKCGGGVAPVEVREEDSRRGGGGKGEVPVYARDQFGKREDEIFDSDRQRHSMEAAKESVERLIAENSEKNPGEMIDVVGYFNIAIFKQLRELLRGNKYFLAESMTRGAAVRKANDIAFGLERKLQQWRMTRSIDQQRWRKDAQMMMKKTNKKLIILQGIN